MSHFVAAAELVPGVPQRGLLVLANGSVIEGTIALDGDYYGVVLEKGKLQIRVDQVDFFCETMAEAYARRKARRIGQSPTVDAHLEVAQWCLQHGLFEFAMAELAEARMIDPQHPLLSLVERRLAQTKELASRVAPPAAAISDDRGSPVVDEHVRPAVASEEAQTSFGEIPVWARTEFIKRIQPMMVHSCANSGCHLPNSPQEMRVDRNALNGVGNPDLIHRNLAAVIAEVDLANPEASRLLTLGATAHGKPGVEQSRPLTPHQLEIVRAWVTQLALRESPLKETEKQPRVAQIVLGMNSSAQQKFIAEEQTAADSPDPFDPAGFNSEEAQPAETPAESTEATVSNLSEPASPQPPPVQE
ncbi:MAG: hypothetical protein SH868_09560 [Bythopirellula sp.]|nr:hypothetical protein [Bythopirellula sp.]